jgi:hypothetical protein
MESIVREKTLVAKEKSGLGKASLWSSILGFVMPFSLVVFGPQDSVGWQRALLGLFVLFELASLACGIAARDTLSGKAGLTVSVIVLLFVLTTLFIHLHIR